MMNYKPPTEPCVICGKRLLAYQQFAFKHYQRVSDYSPPWSSIIVCWGCRSKLLPIPLCELDNDEL